MTSTIFCSLVGSDLPTAKSDGHPLKFSPGTHRFPSLSHDRDKLLKYLFYKSDLTKNSLRTRSLSRSDLMLEHMLPR